MTFDLLGVRELHDQCIAPLLVDEGLDRQGIGHVGSVCRKLQTI